MLDLIPYLAGSNQAASGSTTLVVTIGSNGGWPVIPGDTIIVGGGVSTAVPAGVTDSQGHAYTIQASVATSPASWIATARCTTGLKAAGQGVVTADTVTITWAGTGQNKTAIVAGCYGLVSASLVDTPATPAPAAGSSASPSITTGVLAQAGELVVAVLSDASAGGTPSWAGSGHQAWNNGWTVIDTRQQGTNAYTSMACTQARGTGAKTAAATISNASWTMCAVALKQVINLRGVVGGSCFGGGGGTYADCIGTLSEYQAAQTFDSYAGRTMAESNGWDQPRQKRYYQEGVYPSSGNDQQSVVPLWNSHQIVIAPSFKPKRYAVTDSAIRAAEVVSFTASMLYYRNNGVPAAIILWQECNFGGAHGAFGDGVTNNTSTNDPWTGAGAPANDVAAGQNYKDYCAIFAPVAQSAGYPVWYNPLMASMGDVESFYPGRDLTNGRVHDYYWIRDYWAGEPSSVAPAGVGKGYTMAGSLAACDAETPPLPAGMGEIGPSDASNQTFPDQYNPTSYFVSWFNTYVVKPYTDRLAAGKQNLSWMWYSGHCTGPGRIYSTTPAAVISAIQAAYDALDPSAATTGTPPVITTPAGAITPGQAGVPYSFQFGVTGAAPVTFAVTAGGVPAGLTFHGGLQNPASAGLLDGTPTTAVTSQSFTLQATDGNGLTSSPVTFTLTIAGAALAVPAQALPAGTKGQPYAASLSATGGTPPYTWTTVSAPGAHLNSADMGAASLADAETMWQAALVRPLGARRDYRSKFGIPSSWSGDIAAGTRLCVSFHPDYNPVSSADLAALDSMLSALKAQAADLVVTLYHEPYYAGLTAAQYIAMVAYYGPTVRQYFPLAFVPATSSLAQNNEASFYPGDSQVDLVAADFYEYNYRHSGQALTQAAGLAPGKPFGLWEFNSAFNSAGGSFLNNPSGDFDGGGGGIGEWVNGPSGNCSVAVSSAQAHGGSNSMAMTAAGAGTMIAVWHLATDMVAHGIACQPGDSVTVTAWLLAGSTGRSCQAGVNWFNSSGTSLSTSLGTAAADTTTGWTQVTATVTAPASSAFCRPWIQVASAALGEVHYADDVTIWSAAIAGRLNPAFFGYIQSFMTALPASRRSDLLLFNDNGPGGMSAVVTTGSDSRAVLLRSLWDAVKAPLPPGLSLGSGGGITGTPAAAGTSRFWVQAADTLSATAWRQLTIAVAGTALAVTTTSLPGGTQGTAYTATLTAANGSAPYTWAVVSGALPAGLSLASSTGVISGTPSAAGTTAFTVQVTDSAASTATAALSVTVTASAVLTVTTTSLPGGTAGTAYTAALTAANGTPAYTWAVITGSLPPGLALASSTGVISGTPSASGTFTFTVRVTDSAANAATAQLAIAVPAAGFTITASLPKGFLDTSYSGELDEAGGTGAITWAITSGTLPPGLALAASPAADLDLRDEAGGTIQDEAGGLILDETGPGGVYLAAYSAAY